MLVPNIHLQFSWLGSLVIAIFRTNPLLIPSFCLKNHNLAVTQVKFTWVMLYCRNWVCTSFLLLTFLWFSAVLSLKKTGWRCFFCLLQYLIKITGRFWVELYQKSHFWPLLVITCTQKVGHFILGWVGRMQWRQQFCNHPFAFYTENSKSIFFTCDTKSKRDSNKLFQDLKWDDLTIYKYELKAIRDL